MPDVATTAREIACACGEWSGEPCAWSGPRADTVVVEWMPEHLRASHAAAGNAGQYPMNGARRSRVESSCADRMVEHGARVIA